VLLAVLVLVGVSLGWLVTSPPVTGQVRIPEQSPGSPAKPFHQVHVRQEKIACTACHETAQTPKPGQELTFSVRPGHATCDSCHEDDFKKDKLTASATGAPLCKTCHTGKGEAVSAFPSGKLTLARFSHATHVDPKAKLTSLGGRQDCVFCHKVEATATHPGRAGHPECATCHAGARAAKPVLAKVDEVQPCLACHTLDRIDRNLTTKMAAGSTMKMAAATPTKMAAGNGSSNPHPASYGVPTGPHAYRDIRPFNHGSHLKRRDGAPIDCATCHQPVLDKRAVETVTSRPTMRQCATCHDNATFVRPEHLLKNCEVCHTVMRADLRPRPTDPVSPALVHTEGFRLHHEEQARDPDSQCGVCHLSVVNVDQNKCAGCHSGMPPRSHASLRFADWPHGRLAALDRKVCTTCHTGDFCIACHNVPPRSHIPLQTFRLGAHRDLAALNLRSCFTCHQFESTCARCHRKQLR
jgi:hypothetical protein